jgi:serine/threonine protein kinase/tetratricopeptide (TPR) repeat protein
MIGQKLLNYQITEKLGTGGQGTVYKAIDTRLNRPVVIKVLAPELTSNAASLKRFEREAQLASALDHPNICTIYGLYELNGVHFIVMQYVEGKNVRQLVAGRPLELRSALSIAIQVADALAAAHARGIIHRDIKAGNVMVMRSGQVKVLDFGLAKLLSEGGRSAHDLHLTELGVPYGTATYAAPEQARGQVSDHRTDIFSTGVLLYEMLTGTWPFRGKTSVEVRYAVLHDVPRPIAEFRSGPVPPRLQQIVDRALAKDPKDRYQTITEFRDDLRAVMRELGASDPAQENLIGAVAPRHISTPFGDAIRHWWRRFIGKSAAKEPSSYALRGLPDQTPSQGETVKSVAILPFRNLNNDPAVDFYGFSLADAVITELARLRSLIVRPSSFIAKYQGQTRDPREVGRELGVDAVLDAGFLRSERRFRVNAQLLDVATGEILWSDRIDASADDVIAIQDRIAQQIVERLSIELSTDEQIGLLDHAMPSADAYEEYLKGRDRLGRFIYHTLAREDLNAAINHFERATELDPRFALAHSGLGAAYANRVIKGSGSPEDYARAEEAFIRALEIEPTLIEARMHMVFIFLSRGEKEKARAEAERLCREAPNDVGVHFVRAMIHRLDGEYDEALREYDRMLRLNPAEAVVVSYNRARIFMYQGRYDDALLALARGSALEPDHPLIKTFRALIHYYRGELKVAADTLREVLARHPQMDGIRPLLAIVFSARCEHEAARAMLTERVREAAQADPDVAYWLASAYALEGERDEAFAWFERSIDLGNENLPWFRTDPNLALLREDRRFEQIIARLETSRQRAREGA